MNVDDEIFKSCERARKLWYYQSSARTSEYFCAELSILFSYKLTPFSMGGYKKEQQVDSKARLVVKLDEYGAEYYQIIDTAVFTSHTQTK